MAGGARSVGSVVGVAMGWRFLRRRHGSLAAVVLILALALGAHTLAFSVLEAFLFHSFGVPEPQRLFVVAPVRELPGRGEVVFADAWPNYLLLRESEGPFEEVAATVQRTMSWHRDGETRAVQASRVTASFFRTMRVTPRLGRGFEGSEEGPSPAPVAVLSHELWRSGWDGDPGAIGASILLDGETHTIVGVMPEGFAHPLPTDVWLPFDIPEAQRSRITGARMLSFYGRLRGGVAARSAEAEMAAFTRRAVASSPDNEGYRYALRSVVQVLLPKAEPAVVLVQLGAAVLLLLAVANVSTVLVTWGFDRRQEMAVRLSLGASERRVVGLLVLQNVAVVALGSLAAVAVTGIGLGLIEKLELGSSLELFLGDLRVTGRGLGASAAAAALAAFLGGLLPALMSPRRDLQATLRGDDRGASLSPGALRWQKGMVLGQIMLAVVLASAAAPVAMSLHRLGRVDPGFVPGDAVVARVQLPQVTYGDHGSRVRMAERLLEAAAEEGELASFAFSSTLPVGDVPWGGRFFPDEPGDAASDEPLLFHVRRISPNYPAVMGIPLVRGRPLEPGDDAAQPKVALVSGALAERLWPGEDAVDRVLFRVVGGEAPERIRIVGVVGDVIDAGAAAPPGETVYLPWAQVSLDRLTLVFEPRGDETAALEAVRRALTRTDPSIAAGRVESLASLLRQANALPRLQALLLAAFAGVATAIVALGSYGVMSQLVAVRRNEMAVRLALGASTRSLAASVLRQAAAIAVPGVLVGLGLVQLGSGLLVPFVDGVDPGSPLLAVGVGATVLTVVALATSAPARRAARQQYRILT